MKLSSRVRARSRNKPARRRLHIEELERRELLSVAPRPFLD